MNNEPQNEKTRPTKKQKALLDFIGDFIVQHGYSPSYREIKSGMNYNSVATVALHINSLIKRGHLNKRDNKARSLELTSLNIDEKISSNQVTPKQEKWLVKKVEYYFINAEQSGTLEQSEADSLYVLVGALKILGFEEAANSFIPRLSDIKNKVKK